MASYGTLDDQAAQNLISNARYGTLDDQAAAAGGSRRSYTGGKTGQAAEKAVSYTHLRAHET